MREYRLGAQIKALALAMAIGQLKMMRMVDIPLRSKG